MLRSALIFVSAVALLLAGFARAGGVLGLWEPPQLSRSERGLSVQILHSDDARSASRMLLGRRPNPSPPVSVRSALSIALASAALALLLTVRSRGSRWLSDGAYWLRTRPAGPFAGRTVSRGFAWPVGRGRSVGSRPHEGSVGRVRLGARPILSRFPESLVMVMLSVVLGVAIGVLVAFYAN
jgi:hypothetical protein